MDTLYTYWDNLTHYKTESVDFWGLMNSTTKLELRLQILDDESIRFPSGPCVESVGTGLPKAKTMDGFGSPNSKQRGLVRCVTITGIYGK